MKKFFKLLCGAASIAAAGFGVYCIYKNVIAKKEDEDFDDFEDCFEDESSETADENREYVSINITEETAEPVENADDAAEEVNAPSEEEAADTTDAE